MFRKAHIKREMIPFRNHFPFDPIYALLFLQFSCFLFSFPISQWIRNVSMARRTMIAPKIPSSDHSRTTTVRSTSPPILNSSARAIPWASSRRIFSWSFLSQRIKHFTAVKPGLQCQTIPEPLWQSARYHTTPVPSIPWSASSDVNPFFPHFYCRAPSLPKRINLFHQDLRLYHEPFFHQHQDSRSYPRLSAIQSDGYNSSRNTSHFPPVSQPSGEISVP